MPDIRYTNNWRPILDAFESGKVEFSYPLHQIQTLFSSVGIKIKND